MSPFTPEAGTQRSAHPQLASLRRWLLACAVLALAGCSILPMRTLWALRQFDMMAFDPAELRAAVRLPKQVSVLAQAVAIDLSIQRGSTGEVIKRQFWLRPAGPVSRHGASHAAPAAAQPAGDALLLVLDEADQKAVRALQAQGALWKAQAAASAPAEAAGKNRVSLSVKPQLCRHGPAAAGQDERVSAWLRWAPQPGWLPVAEDAALQSLLSDDAPAMPACPG